MYTTSKEAHTYLTVITVCFNSVSTIRKTLESIRSEKVSGVEYIIIDGGSTDGTLEIVDEFIGVVDVLVSQNDAGLYDAMNKGISKASGDYIAYLNSDDYYQSGFVRALLEGIRNSGGVVDVFYGDVAVPKSSGLRLYKSRSPVLHDLFLKGLSLYHPSMAVKKYWLVRFGFLLDYKIVSDYILVVQLVQAGCKFKYVSGMVTVFAEGGVSSKFWQRIKEGVRARKFLGASFHVILRSTGRRLLFGSVSYCKRFL